MATHRQALLEFTRERAPLGWAMTQSNLGDALQLLAVRAHHPAQLCDAVSAHLGAWAVFHPSAPPYVAIVENGIRTDLRAMHHSGTTKPPCKALSDELWRSFVSTSTP